jgi:hypothetical protein
MIQSFSAEKGYPFSAEKRQLYRIILKLRSMNNYLNKLIMYHEIHKMSRGGLSINSIADFLNINWRTVKSYLLMSEHDFEVFMNQSQRSKELHKYESFIKVKLEQYQSTSAAQMHDWLKEHYPDFPKKSAKTIYNFVMWVRQKYNLPKVKHEREYCIVADAPWGKQAQVDFGEYSMRSTTGNRKKVYFFCMVLSRSRFKYVCFSSVPFTTHIVVEAHEKAFEYFRGIPEEIVYDQDKVFIKDENHGDLLLTQVFKLYVKERGYHVHFCRKADPESKGKVENMVKYVKQNFLYNRPFSTEAQLNTEALLWLSRTANYMPHGRTQEAPHVLWQKEQPCLTPYISLQPNNENLKSYTVRKDNSIMYKSSMYSLPQGTWKGVSTTVFVKEHDGVLILLNQDKQEICRHQKSTIKGKTVVNNNHRRDSSNTITELKQKVSQLFIDSSKALVYFDNLQKVKSRYMRDQLRVIEQCFDKFAEQSVNQALDVCIAYEIYSATNFEAIALSKETKTTIELEKYAIKTLPNCKVKAQELQPNRSNIDLYQQIMKN